LKCLIVAQGLALGLQYRQGYLQFTQDSSQNSLFIALTWPKSSSFALFL
jgi:hypothetical protein